MNALQAATILTPTVEHVIGFLVRSMEPKKLHLPIDLPIEANRLRHLVHQTDAACGNCSHTEREHDN